ncbi:MAG: bifunctional diguanylate cyclase/phosphodiesterase [Candidatus Eremiobacteraeota bacterium]|nr:bifunctional diguanylate cyclase/phosphodiesterase [Candidatus Eremiobacteraeota bacterium]MCW5866157.1 bifunctional diguanylate cyclase/phosphodiesterase [Candidatus Eremiobacteraeota bacterium]
MELAGAEEAELEGAEAEMARLTAWAEYSQQRIALLEDQVQRGQEQLQRAKVMLSVESDLVTGLRMELKETRFQLEQLREAPDPPEADSDELALRRLALQDPVTGLPNFHHGLRTLEQYLAGASRVGGLAGLARIDIYRLRDLNLYLGSQVGDEILRQFTSRFQGVTGPDCLLIRGRDDEFWLLAPCTSGGPLGLRKLSDQLSHAIERLAVALKRPFEVGDHSVHLSVACGIAIGQDEEAGQLLECAALALAESKKDPGGPTVFYAPEMQGPIRARLARVPQLRQALENQEFELAFQPIVELESLQVQGLESLLRWNHPEEGLLLPAQFIEAAVESGVIVSIGEWVARQICHYSQQAQPYLWSMNVSAQELLQANFMRRITRAIEGAELTHPEYLVVEVSEAGLAGDSDRLLGSLQQLREWGVRIAIDDFSFDRLSLRRLSQLDVSYLKISPAVTHQLEQPLYRNLVRGAVLTAECLGCKVVAEGVEQMEQLEALKELGCHWGQGHLLQPPASLEEIWELL